MNRPILSLLMLAGSLSAGQPLSLSLQTRNAVGATQSVAELWEPTRTAIIVCDMWDLHHCRNAVIREGEMAPRMNLVLAKARASGVLIIHAPSSCTEFYEGTPARLRAISAPPAGRLPDKIGAWCSQIPAEERAVYPLDQSDGGEDDSPDEHAAWAAELKSRGLNPRQPWIRQIDLLHIDQSQDVISDSGIEIWNVLEARGIRNVILMGVHLNMCVSGRPFGLRQMARNGKHVVLMRDLTDSMYNPNRWPFVSHVRGTELFVEHVEKHICPTITSDQLIGGSPFRFSDATAGPDRLRILLLGDSTTEAKFPKLLSPDEPQLEDLVRIRLAGETNLPPVDVVNLGLSGDTIRRLLDSGRYERLVAGQSSADYVFIRYGINDHAKREDFEINFPKDFHELIARLRRDHPGATLIPTTVIPFSNQETSARINRLVRLIANKEKLPLFDIYPAYESALKNGPNMLNYRRYSLSKVPEQLRHIAHPHVHTGKDPQIVVLDNRLDPHFGHLPGWYSDRHPNLAGYHVIAAETARFLAPMLASKNP